MPGYTRAWDVLTWLLGARDADEIDDATRDLGTDLDERLRDVTEDIEADPIRLKTLGAITTIPWHSALVFVTSGSAAYDVIRLTLGAANSQITAYIPIVAPKGSLLTNLVVRVLRTHAGASALISLHRINANNTQTNIVNAFATIVDPSPQDIDLGALTEVFGEDVKFVVSVALTAEAVVAPSAALYHVKATIDTVWGGA